jgi:hypothetical protein
MAEALETRFSTVINEYHRKSGAEDDWLSNPRSVGIEGAHGLRETTSHFTTHAGN